ncbi:DUF4294 domain-containing protein [Capnocytophaga catalasegens]|nr:DUF4294 domain-containing protein [Capnocytophaga catalasegens]
MWYRVLFLLCFLSMLPSVAQTLDTLNTIEQDELEEIIQLEEVWVYSREPYFGNAEARKNYLILRNRVRKVYPYAKLAAEELQRIQKTLDTIPNNRKKKKFTKKVQEETEKRFTDELKKLSRSQGKILIKLIYRQTGDTAFDLVKNLRSGWRAFWYNKTAWFYDLSLKASYDPLNVIEDYWIEDVLQRAFASGELEYQPPAIKIDYEKLKEKAPIPEKTN